MKNIISIATCPECGGSRAELHSFLLGTRVWVCRECGESFEDNDGSVGAKRQPSPREIGKLITQAEMYPNLVSFKNFYNSHGIDSIYAAAQVKRMVEGGYLEMDAEFNITPTPEGARIAEQERQRPRAACPVCGKEAVLIDLPRCGKIWACEDHLYVPDDNGKPQAPRVCQSCGKNSVFHYASHGVEMCAECGAGWKKGKLVEHRCPVCHGTIHKVESKKTGIFWKCFDCETSFADVDGKPQAPQVCPSCGGKSLTRFEAMKAPGVYFWGCGSCQTMFADENGERGEKFEA